MSVLSGKLIAVEGVDGVGKNTQANLLLTHLRELGHKCSLYSFPQYETETGIQIGKYLNSQEDTNPFELSELFIKNRLEVKDEIIQKLNDGEVVICDRWSLSNAVYYTATYVIKGMEIHENIGKSDEFHLKNHETIRFILGSLEDILKREHIHYRNKTAHKTIVLGMSPESASKQVALKPTRDYTDKKLDKNEANVVLQKVVSYIYSNLIYIMKYSGMMSPQYSALGQAKVINCETDSGEVKTIEQIHNLILRAL